MTEPKLMTEAEWANLIGLSAWSKAQGTIRKRGLIAPEPEPVDPLLDEAKEICVKCFTSRNYSQTVIDRLSDNDTVVQIALTALRRNLELAERPTLTREMVLEAHREVYGKYCGQDLAVARLHAALVERLK